jgi:hypothetical protein
VRTKTQYIMFPSQHLMSKRNFFAEPKGRNVHKAAAAYAVLSSLLIQAASIIQKLFL